MRIAGEVLGGGGGFDALLTQRDTALVFLRNPFLAPIYTNFEAKPAKKRDFFWSEFSKKCPETDF